MSPFVVAIPVAAGTVDHARVADLLASIAAHEPRATDVLIVDDEGGRAPAPRSWPHPSSPSRPPGAAFTVSVLPNPRRGRGIPSLGGTTAGTLAALAWAHARRPGAWVLRLDADALVIGPFADAIDAALQPGDGILGSCHRTCNGNVRDVGAIAAEVARHRRPVWAWRHPPRRPWWIRPADPHVRDVLRGAARSGYVPGEHCIAAGCAISPALVGALAARGWLDDPTRWLHARLGDDMVLGAMTRACGLALRDLPAVFGITHRGLPDSPPALRERGFAIIHSVKNDPASSEEQIRAFFAAARDSATPAAEPVA
ncbi:hypothetical protein DSM112329_04969 [Paraconexibacter sp. AEG42_29]|uniref:Glycosyltransferase n=1 Tax=Paraconexibacter sp. AEG42_29 TaxID=2997339 RepID=A0AAU7B2F9_9ACTN